MEIPIDIASSGDINPSALSLLSNTSILFFFFLAILMLRLLMNGNVFDRYAIHHTDYRVRLRRP